MKLFSLPYRLATCLSMVILTICHPLAQAQVPSSSIQEVNIAPSAALNGKFENGMTYTVIPSSILKGAIWIKFAFQFQNQEELAAVARVTQQALFYGTHKYSRQAIADTLNNLGLDVDPETYITSNELEQSFEFCLSHDQFHSMGDLLTLVNEILFSPALQDKAVARARDHLSQSLDETSEEALALEDVTADEVRDFYAKWYIPAHMQLTVIASKKPHKVMDVLTQVFGTHSQQEIEVPSAINHPTLEEVQAYFENEPAQLADALTQHIELASDGRTRVIDGKIWMKEPNWINTSSKGKTLGAALTLLGVGGAVLGFPTEFGPFAVIAGVLSATTGIHLMTTDYLKDPHYVDSVRKQDLAKGCAHAYKNRRAGVTMTPYERRVSFLQEMVDHPQTLPRRPISLLADLYQLHDPVIAEIFTRDEFEVVNRLKRDFVQQRNQYKMFKESLENELSLHTAPFALTRNAALAQVKEVYNQNYYVLTKQALKASRDKRIQAIEKDFKNQLLTLDLKKAYIQKENDYYEECLAAPDFAHGLDLARRELSQRQLQIEATYRASVELCKHAIHYYDRLSAYQQGENALTNYYDQELRHLLSAFPVHNTAIRDYLDLTFL